jgi:hypothetical protein
LTKQKIDLQTGLTIQACAGRLVTAGTCRLRQCWVPGASAIVCIPKAMFDS